MAEISEELNESSLDNLNTKDISCKIEQHNSDLPKDLVLIYSTEDERIKEVGKLLASDTSRTILKMLFSETLTTKQIAQRMNCDIPLVKHHIDRMLELGIIKIEKVTKSVKERDVKCYTASHLAVVVLSPPMVDRAKKSKILIRSFRLIHKLSVVGIAAVSTWIGTWVMQNPDRNVLLLLPSNNDSQQTQIDPDSSTVEIPTGNIPNDSLSSFWSNLWNNVPNDIFWPTTFTILAVSVCLFLIWRKNRK